jgi:adenylate cyclase
MWVGATIGIVSALAVSGLARIGFVRDFAERVENSTYDLRVRREAIPVRTDSPVVMVEINESTLRALEPIAGRWPWPRFVHASAIDYLARSGARVIAYDVLFTDTEGRSELPINGRIIRGDESDAALVDSVGRAGNVILLADATYAGLLSEQSPAPPAPPALLPFDPGGGFLARPHLLLPFERLAKAAAGLGHNYLEKDGTVHHVAPFLTYGGRGVPSLGLAAALAFANVPPRDVKREGEALRIGAARMPLVTIRGGAGPSPDTYREALLRFAASTRRPEGDRTLFPSYSFFDVLLSEDQQAAGKPPAIRPSAFAGKLVFIGTTAAGLYDRVTTPFEEGAAGVELHGLLADNVLSGLFMRRSGAGADFAMSLILALAGGLSAALLPVPGAVAATGLSVAAAGGWLLHEVGRGVWIAEAVPAVAAATALFAGVAWRYFVEDREKRTVRRLFGRYVSNDVIDQLMADPAGVRLGGQRRDMTVLFSDIRGFTTATEQGEPEAVVAQLNEYFGAMVEVLFRHQGTLDKFVGDMVMGLFGAPLEDPAHPDHAVGAALDMVATLDALNVRWRAEGRPELKIGIGINTGEMIAGNIGSEAIMSYTVIGDAVNLGSRLESLNKTYGTRILISDATRRRLTRPVDTRVIGDVVVKGKTQPVLVHEVCLASREHAG